jgi:hypothetical protein
METPMKPIVLSPYMANVNPAVKDAQLRVMNKLCTEIPFVQVLTNRPHGKTLDGLLHTSIGKGYDTVMFMDIDAIPLSSYAIEHTLIKAHKGTLIGNIQRSNHINNNQHLFVAPSFMAINLDLWIKAGRPSFSETARGDVAEEVTYAWQDKGWNTQMYMPLRYEASPVECPSWALADGMPHYGLGTTFGIGNTAMSYHAFQIRMGGMVERFLSKCDSVLADK